MRNNLITPRAGSLLAVEFLLFNFVELKRLQDFNKPGSQAEPGSFFGFEGAFKGTGENGYPGGIFDPLNFSKCASKAMFTLEVFLKFQPYKLSGCCTFSILFRNLPISQCLHFPKTPVRMRPKAALSLYMATGLGLV